MRLTSATLSDVWPDEPPLVPPPLRPSSSPSPTSARITHVVQGGATATEETVRLRALIDAMDREMTQRTHLFGVILIAMIVILVQRMRRLEQRLVMQTMGAHPHGHWW